ncbi:hypothetical protein LWM68_17185 [Niabella sp. W65]|nr:hypothetical protein [Niabella sp. W65]MCH7364331.1 hypothetical protein [Niabella sp. W65]
MKTAKGAYPDQFRNGDHTVTLISTEKGKSIEVQHNVMTPRPYSRMYQLTGTKGFANKYPSEGYALDGDQVSSDITPDHEKLSAHGYVSKEIKEALMKNINILFTRNSKKQLKR